MSLLVIAWKSLRQRRLASALTTLSIGLGVMLMVLVLVISSAVGEAFDQRSTGYDLIVGPKGSDLQLVLSAMYRIQPPIENLPYMYLEQLREDRRIVSAVPLAFGDFTQDGGFPIVGTTEEYFENDYLPGRSYRIRGRRIAGLFETIIGTEVARRNGWDVGSQFSIVHGGKDSDKVHTELFTVVAVLAPTGTADDRTVFLDLNGFYAIDGHSKPIDEIEKRLRDFYASDPQRLSRALAELALERAEHAAAPATETGGSGQLTSFDAPAAMKEVTAILVKTRPDTPFDSFSLKNELQKGYQAMAVNPIGPIQRLTSGILGNVQKALVVLIGIIILVSGVGIFVSIYNSMADRRREIGIMRALGAARQHVFLIVLCESALLCVGGGLLGWLTGHGLAILAAPWVIDQTGLLVDPWKLNAWESLLFPVLLGMSVIVGFLPAMTAYRTDVADALTN
jgi:putative ABC transport system permease protein